MIRTRIAPSPTGMPHIGIIWQALINYSYAKGRNGSFLVRIEDTDQERKSPSAEQAIYKALDWFDLLEDESTRKGGPYSAYRQSERLPLYKKHAEQLVAQGNAYYCFCSEERLAKVRESQKKRGIPPMYDQYCRSLDPTEVHKKLEKGEENVIRLKVPKNQTIVVNDLLRGDVEFDSNTVDDQVLIKSDGFPTYHLAVVVDDHLMKISHTVRGEEWLSSAPKHILLYKYLGWELPVLVHTPTIRNSDGSKLSKREGHAAVSWYCEQGYLPEALLNFLCLLGWSHPEEKEIFPLETFINLFDLKDLSVRGPVFDLTKLEWMNGKYIRNMSVEELIAKLKNYNSKLKEVDEEYLEQLVPLVQERMKTLKEFDELTLFFFGKPKIDLQLLVQENRTAEEVAQSLHSISNQLMAIDTENWIHSTLEKISRDFVAANDAWKTGQLFMTLRIAVTGSKVSPPLFETMEVLGKETCLNRLEKAAEAVETASSSTE